MAGTTVPPDSRWVSWLASRLGGGTRGRRLEIAMGGHRRRSGPSEHDRRTAHDGEGGRSDSEPRRVRGEILLKDPHAERDAHYRVNDDQQRLGHAERPYAQRGLVENL